MVPNCIIVHCSDSTWGSIEELDSWHKDRGFKRKGQHTLGSIGYHRIITNGHLLPKSAYDALEDGKVYNGRELDEVGAHCLGLNGVSLGVCCIGRIAFTELQQLALMNELHYLCKLFNLRATDVLGHYETKSGREQGKSCPNMNMNVIRSKLLLRGV